MVDSAIYDEDTCAPVQYAFVPWWAWSSKEPTVQYTVKIRKHQCNMHIALWRMCTLV